MSTVIAQCSIGDWQMIVQVFSGFYFLDVAAVIGDVTLHGLALGFGSKY